MFSGVVERDKYVNAFKVNNNATTIIQKKVFVVD